MGHLNNNLVAEKLYEIADLLEMKGVEFKPRAYRNAARSIETLSEDIKNYYKKDKLKEISGIGESIASKIKEILETGELEYLIELRQEFPENLQEMMNVQGVGPKTILKLYKNLDISSLEELEKAANDHKIEDIKGFGEKSEENILKSIQMYKKYQKRRLLGDIIPIAKDLEKSLKNLKYVSKLDIAGSFRRKKETVGDLDILITSDDPQKVMNYFTEMENIERVLSKGKTKSTVILSDNLQIDLRVIDEKSYGSALLYFTGSKEHNIELRKLANEKEWKLSEYGLIDEKNKKTIASKTEQEVFDALGLQYIEPELRENRGEIDAAKDENLPNLVTLDDIKGDLHVHSDWSEGKHTIEEMAEIGKKRGYEYIAICDHSKTLQIAQGMDDKELKNQIKEIDKINESLDDFTILKGVEANVNSEGKLDVSNNVLKDLDLVVASIHSGFKNSEEKITQRAINAMHNDYTTILGHPTGRLINKREPYDIDMIKIFETAQELGIHLELNSYRNRLDLSDMNCFRARDYDIYIAIDTDSHSKEHMRYMDLGVFIARRGWLEPRNVLNTRSLSDLKKLI